MIQAYQEVIRLNPGHAKAQYYLGCLYKKKGKFDLAMDSYKAAIRIKPDLALAHNNPGTIYTEKEEHDLVTESYTEAIRVKPDGLCTLQSWARPPRRGGNTIAPFKPSRKRFTSTTRAAT